jgi:hypothetical protein
MNMEASPTHPFVTRVRALYDRREHPIKGVFRTASALGANLESSSYFSGLQFCNRDSMFHTNAIKSYLRKDLGKRASQLTDEMFDEHEPTFLCELDVMAEHGVLPHVIVIFGNRFWTRLLSAFSKSAAAKLHHLRVRESTPQDLRFMRLRLEDGKSEQTTLVVRARHPAARCKAGLPTWFLGQPRFRAIAGIPSERSAA